MSSFNFSSKIDGKTGFVNIAGSIDAHNAPEFDKKMKDILSKTKKIILDFSKMDYISTAGLGVLMASFNEAKTGGGNIIISGLPDNIKKVFDTMGFSKVFKITASVEQAKSLL